MIFLGVVALVLMFFNAILKYGAHEKNGYSMMLEPSRSSDMDHKRSPNDYFTVVKTVEKISGFTRIAVYRSSDGWMFSAFWTKSREPISGEKVTLKSYLYNFSPGSQQTIAFAYPDSGATR